MATDARIAAADRGEPFGVPAPDRLLDPGEVQGALQLADVPDRLLAGPGLVGVEHQARPRAARGLGQHVAHQRQAVPVPLDVEAALELGRPQSALGVGLVDRDEFVVGQADVQAGGVRGDRAVTSAEQPPQRFPGRLRLDVPQGGVERADGAEDGARVAGLEGLPEHPVVQRRDAARVLALDGGEDGLQFHVRTRARRR